MSINPGELKERLSILELKKNENTYSWEQVYGTWSKYEQLSGNNLFSKVGLGAKSIKFTIRKRNGLTMHNSFRWKGKHCFLTDIMEIDRMYYEVTAALIEPRSCSVERTGEPILDELNRPIYEQKITVVFPGCLTEKYIGYTQGEPMAYTETRYVLITSKPVELVVGELVTIEDTTYSVIIIHSLDEYKNEYEIKVEEDS